MSTINSFSFSLINNLVEKATQSPITTKLSAVLLQNKKPIGPLLHNNHCMNNCGKACSSLHAEANVLLNHFKSSLRFTNNKWEVLRKKSKVSK